MPSGKIIFLFLAVYQFAIASEHEAPAASEHGGGAAPVAKEYSGKQSQDWSEVQTKLAALKAKVDAQEIVVKSLIQPAGAGGHEAAASGGHESAPATGHGAEGAAAAESHAANKFEQLKKEDEKLQTLIKQYNKLNTEYETKFPEKGLKESRIYRRSDSQSAEPIENGASSYEVKLKLLQNKILQQYPKAAKASVHAKKARTHNVENKSKSTENSVEKQTPPSGGVTDQIILQK